MLDTRALLHESSFSLQSDVALRDAVVFTILRHLSLSSAAALTASVQCHPCRALDVLEPCSFR